MIVVVACPLDLQLFIAQTFRMETWINLKSDV